MITYLKAKYIGDTANNGYHAGQVYFLEVRQHWFGRITVRPTHGYRFKPLEDMRLVYHNLEVFLASWNILHIVEMDDW